MNYLLLTYKKKLCWIFFLLGFVHYPYLFSLQKVFTFPQNWVLSTFPPIPNTTTTTTTTTKNSCLRVWTLNLFFLQKCITLTFYLFKIFQRYNILYTLYICYREKVQAEKKNRLARLFLLSPSSPPFLLLSSFLPSFFFFFFISSSSFFPPIFLFELASL